MDLPGCVPVLPGKVPSGASGASGDALTAVVENDLPAAIQLQIGTEVKVLYPEGRHSFQDQPLPGVGGVLLGLNQSRAVDNCAVSPSSVGHH